MDFLIKPGRLPQDDSATLAATRKRTGARTVGAASARTHWSGVERRRNPERRRSRKGKPPFVELRLPADRRKRAGFSVKV